MATHKKQYGSPLDVAAFRASSVSSIISSDTVESTRAIMDNLVSQHGLHHISYSAVNNEEYRLWKQTHKKELQEFISGDKKVKSEKLEESSLYPESVVSGVYKDIGIRGELNTLSLLETELRLKILECSVESDQTDRSCMIGEHIMLKGRFDALIKKPAANGKNKKTVVGLVEVKTRMREFRDDFKDKVQLAIYCQMIGKKISYYMLVQRVHGSSELKITKYTYEELQELWDNTIRPGMLKAYATATSIWAERKSGSVITATYYNILMEIVDYLRKIIMAIEADGSNPVPLLADLLQQYKLETSAEVDGRIMYDTFAATITPLVKLKVKKRDIDFFQTNLESIIGQTVGIVSKYKDAVATIIITGITEASREKLWVLVCKLLDTV